MPAQLVSVTCNHGPEPKNLAPGLRVPVGSKVTWPTCKDAKGAQRIHVATAPTADPADESTD